MLRAAAKNHARVAVLVDPADYAVALGELRAGGVTEPTRRRLAAKAFAHTAAYDAAGRRLAAAPAGRRRLSAGAGRGFPQEAGPALWREPAPAGGVLWRPARRGSTIATARQLQGKELSYNNIADADTAIECVRQFDAPACVIVKHANPCGVAVAADLCTSLRTRLRTRPDLGLRRHHRLQPPARREDCCRDRRAPVRRGDRGAGLLVRGARSSSPPSRMSACCGTGPLDGASPAAVELKSVAGGLLAQTRRRRQRRSRGRSRPSRGARRLPPSSPTCCSPGASASS